MRKKISRIVDIIPAGILTAVVFAAILWLTLAPHPLGAREIPLFTGADKVAHILMFAALELCVLTDIRKLRPGRAPRLPLIAATVAGCILLGVGIEILQRAMGLGRSFEVWDIIADAFGSVAVAAIWTMVAGLRSENGDHR